MGLLGDLFRGGRIKDPVRGSAQVVSCEAHRGDSSWQNCRMQLVVRAPGVAPTSVEHRAIVRADRWPVPGMALPATIDRSDPTRVKIEWDEVESSRDRSRRTAEGLAAAMRGDAGAAADAPAMDVNVVNLSAQDLSELSEDEKAKLRMLGVYPDALAAAVQAQPVQPPPGAPPQR